MNSLFENAASEGTKQYPNTLGQILEYGTAGFRDKSSTLPHVMYRMGLLAVLRSKAKNGATIGVMITASHNPEEDNGVKLCDPMGKMMDFEWEVLATELANCNDDMLSKSLQRICDMNNINTSVASNVFLAMDTRSSSPELAAAVTLGVNVLQGNLQNLGFLTTPQLHYVVCCQNTNGAYGLPTKEGYYAKFSSAFSKLNATKVNECYVPHVIIDCANGIGARALKDLIPFLKEQLKIEIFNAGSTNLNYMCGADYVKVQQKVPLGTNVIPGERYASLDGDADRLIYFYLDASNKFCILDGDKISTLIAKYFKKLLANLELDAVIRVIQTAYANSSSTQYIENILKIPTVCVPTGVKHLHHEAMKYDIGIYFEANGHGTVLFNKNVKDEIKSMMKAENISNCEKLLNAIDLTNETVGDAISDMLLVETALRDFDCTVEDWYNMYHDLPNRQLKVLVEDRTKFVSVNAICKKPEGLQDCIDVIVITYNKSRAFVRPSGTENIIRVYAEADTQENADKLANDISDKVKEFAAKA